MGLQIFANRKANTLIPVDSSAGAPGILQVSDFNVTGAVFSGVAFRSALITARTVALNARPFLYIFGASGREIFLRGYCFPAQCVNGERQTTRSIAGIFGFIAAHNPLTQSNPFVTITIDGVSFYGVAISYSIMPVEGGLHGFELAFLA